MLGICKMEPECFLPDASVARCQAVELLEGRPRFYQPSHFRGHCPHFAVETVVKQEQICSRQGQTNTCPNLLGQSRAWMSQSRSCLWASAGSGIS